MSIHNTSGRVQDRTYTSIMEEYLKALPPDTQVTAKMLVMHGVPERLVSTYMYFFVKWGAARRVEGSIPPAIVYTPQYDKRGSKVEWKVPEGEGGRPSAKKKEDDVPKPYMTQTGRELKVAEPPAPPPEPEKVKIDDMTLNEVREAMRLLLKEFGLALYRKGGEFSLE